MTRQFCRVSQRSNETRRLLSFGHQDRHGRVIGARIQQSVVSLVEREGGLGRPINLPPGTYFALHCQATRNGQEYGAWQSERYFATDDERAQAAQAYRDAALKRAEKRAGR